MSRHGGSRSARSHLLVLWSRLGDFDRAHLDTLLWRERWLFEYWARSVRYAGPVWDP